MDQVASSGSNILANVLIARVAGPSGLGVFTVVFTAYLVVLGLSRTFFSEPLLVTTVLDHRGESSVVVRNAIVLYCTATVTGAALSFAIDLWMLPISLLVAGATIQDNIRFLAFKRGLARVAAEMDLAWIGFMLVLVPIFFMKPAGEYGAVAWSSAGTLSAAYGFARLGLRPRWHGLLWRQHFWPYARYLLVDSIGNHATAQLQLFLVLAYFGTHGTGIYRAAQFLLSPGVLLITGATLALAPRIASHPSGETRHAGDLRLVAVLGSAVALGILVIGPVTLRVVLGTAYSGATSLVPPTAMLFATLAVSAPIVVRLKAARNGSRLAGARLAAVIIGAPLLIVSALFGDLALFTWAVALQGVAYLLALRPLTPSSCRFLERTGRQECSQT